VRGVIHFTYNIINNENIADLYKEAANLNDKNAFYHLGLMDIEARPQKLQSAIRSFETCAKLGLAECSTALGDIYATEDNVLSEKYYETAMKSGDTDGMFKYALILIRSDDVNRKEKGKALLKLAGELRNFKAKRVYADLVNDGVIQDDFPGKNTLLFKLYCETWLHGDKESGKILEANFSKDKVEDMCQFYRQTYNASMLFKIQNHIPLNGLEAKYPFLPFGLLFYEDIDLLQITDELKARKK